MLTNLLLSFLVASSPSPQGSPPSSNDWHVLVDAEGVHGLRSFRGEAFPQRGWEVVDGVLRHTEGGGGGDLVTTDEYRDFVLDFEWKVTEGANSGVMYRVSEELDQTYFTGPEYQVLDNAKYQKNGPEVHAAALYGLYAAQDAKPRAVGEWNQARILVIGQYIEHWLNGKRVVQAVLDSDDWNRRVEGSKFKQWPQFGKQASGRIAFQDHGNEVEYRGIRILDLGTRRPGRDLLKEPLPTWSIAKGYDADDKDFVVEEGVLRMREYELGDEMIGIGAGTGEVDENASRLVWKLEGHGVHFAWDHYGGTPTVLLLNQERQVETFLMHLDSQSDSWFDTLWTLYVPDSASGQYAALDFKRTLKIEDSEKFQWRQVELTVWDEHAVLRVNGEVLQQAWGQPRKPELLQIDLYGGDGMRNLGTTGLPALP